MRTANPKFFASGNLAVNILLYLAGGIRRISPTKPLLGRLAMVLVYLPKPVVNRIKIDADDIDKIVTSLPVIESDAVHNA